MNPSNFVLTTTLGFGIALAIGYDSGAIYSAERHLGAFDASYRVQHSQLLTVFPGRYLLKSTSLRADARTRDVRLDLSLEDPAQDGGDDASIEGSLVVNALHYDRARETVVYEAGGVSTECGKVVRQVSPWAPELKVLPSANCRIETRVAGGESSFAPLRLEIRMSVGLPPSAEDARLAAK